MKKLILITVLSLSLCGCMRISFGQGCKVDINADNGGAVNIGNKDIPVNATVTPVIPR